MTGLSADFEVRRSEDFRLELQLEIPPGTTAALLGPNGAGKSTAVAAIAGLIRIDAGSISLGGEILDDPSTFVPPEERRIGVVFQDYLLFEHLTVLENVAFGLRSRGVGRPEARTRASEWLDRMGLPALADRRPGDLSGGQAQRVALARALATDPGLLLLDEPLAALDVRSRAEMRHLLAEHLAAFRGPRLLITHDPTEAFLLADEIHVIEDGVVTQSGTPDDIVLRPRTAYAADLVGANLLAGRAQSGVVNAGGRPIHIGDDEITGPVLLTIHPHSISLHGHRPDGSPRNTWETTVERVERLGPRTRVRTAGPVPLTVEVTEQARGELGLDRGSTVWVAFKATEVGVQPDEWAGAAPTASD